MIKQIYVCECDICGAVEKAKAVNAYRNDTDYQMPNDWTHGKNSEICICPTCSVKLNGSKTTPTPTYISNAEAVPVYGCPVAYEATSGVTIDPIIISANTTNIESKVVLDADTAKITADDFDKPLKDLKIYCSSQDSCEKCPIAYFDEKLNYYHCNLTATHVFEWQDIANKLKDEHETLAECIEIIANHCRDDIRYCEDCRYCRSFDRCDLQLHNPADWVIYDDIKDSEN